MKRKGLSQVLWLIIAAAVLMMVSMTLTMTTNNTLGGFGQQTTVNQCENIMSNKVSSKFEGDVFLAPASCYSSDGNPVTYQSKLNSVNPGNRDCIEKTASSWSTTGTAASTQQGCTGT